ncbi:MAG: aminoacyl-tRNA deacylase [Burkholderiales bacterium]|jgi:Cys-tRNA(Pro) deacylase|nr:aminoacyl-tRNA deacylase [Burkholderiales bacterium]
MNKDTFPVTTAIRVLRAQHVPFIPCLYTYEVHGGTTVSARELGVPERSVIKTLVMEDDGKKPLIVLMHGDCEVSTKSLARLLRVKTIQPCAADVAEKHSGYQIGGTSPFGTRKALPVYMERSIADLPTIYINGGKRGFLVAIASADLIRVLRPTLVEVAVAPLGDD